VLVGRSTRVRGEGSRYLAAVPLNAPLWPLAGLLASQASRTGRAGDLAVLAGLVWFAPVWVGWELGPPLVRSFGTIAAGFAFPLLFYLVLAFPGGRLPDTHR
jgi:hypothetical protein